MLITKHTHSIAQIPRQSGTWWVKAKNPEGRTFVIPVQYSSNMYQSILQANKDKWLKMNFQSIWIEVLADTDITHAA